MGLPNKGAQALLQAEPARCEDSDGVTPMLKILSGWLLVKEGMGL